MYKSGSCIISLTYKTNVRDIGMNMVIAMEALTKLRSKEMKWIMDILVKWIYYDAKAGK